MRRKSLCACGHQRGHHIDGYVVRHDEEDGEAREEVIGAVQQCFGKGGGEDACDCSYFRPAGYVEQFISDDEVERALRTLYAHTTISGGRFLLLTHIGQTAAFISNATDPREAYEFLERSFGALAERSTPEGGGAVVERAELSPIQSKTDARRFVLLPDPVSMQWTQYEERLPVAWDDDDDDDDDQEGASDG